MSPTRPTARPLGFRAPRLRKPRGQVSPPGVFGTTHRSRRRPGWRSPSDKAADDVEETGVMRMPNNVTPKAPGASDLLICDRT